MGVGLFTNSCNNTLFRSKKNRVLGEKLITRDKYFFGGKFAEGKTPNISVTFLVK